MYFDGHDLTQIVVAIIGGFAGLAVVVASITLPVLLSIRRSSKRTERQVSNDHPTNMREENDARHEENRAAIATLTTLVQASDRRNAQRNTRTNRRIDAVARRLDIVEDGTIPREELRKRMKK